MALARKATLRGDAVRQIVDAAQLVDVVHKGAWSELDALSSRTVVDSIEVDPAGVILKDDGSFEGSANVYVTLNYGPSDENLSMAEAFLGRFEGRIVGGKLPEINHFSVDTSHFYEGEGSLGEVDDLECE